MHMKPRGSTDRHCALLFPNLTILCLLSPPSKIDQLTARFEAELRACQEAGAEASAQYANQVRLAVKC